MPVPTGTITFLFSDIEGSTRLWENHPEAMRVRLARHDAILREACERYDGFVFKTVGDAFCVAFDTAVDAVRAAAAAQNDLHGEDWGETGPLRVRMAIHVGAAEYRDGDYFGNPLNRVARMLGATHGGQILISLPVEEMVRDQMPSEITLLDLGEHRLRDLNRPERIFQVNPARLPTSFPPLRTLEALPNNLPTNLSSFVGREREVREVRELLGETRLLTLTGTGGTGKTRLSVQVAADLLDRYPDGVWFIELATLADPARVIDAVATALDIRADADVPLRVSVLRYLRNRRVLLILDNCEHLLEACAELSAELLRTCQHLRILATSRHSLGISGERTWAVPPLAVLDPARDLFQVPDLVARISQYEAVRLFIDRASAAKPGFAVNQKNAPAIAQICWRLDGIPLAIELAAARAKVLEPEQIARRLDDRFRLLTGGNRSVLPHQQTLRTLIDWSYDLLSESERVLFRRLGTFGGGRTLDAIENVCTGDGVDEFDALDLLQHLVDKSLLSVEEEADGSTRYTMIESVWQYARERLEDSGEMPSLRNRHLDYFLKLAEEAQTGLEGPDVAEWLERIDADRFNFRLALDWASRDRDNVWKGLKMAGLLARYLEIRGNLEEAKQSFERILSAPGAEDPSEARALALAGAGRIAWCQDRTSEAEVYYTAAATLYESLGMSLQAALSFAFLGFMERNSGQLDAAEKRFSASLEVGKATNNLLLTAVSLSGLGTVAGDRNKTHEARKLKEESLKIYRQVGDKWVTGYILWGVARACVAEGDTFSARAALAEWIEIARELKNRWALPYVMHVIGDILIAEDNLAGAARVFGAAEAAREALAINLDSVDTRCLSGSLDRLRAKIDLAVLDREWALGRQVSVWEAIDRAMAVEGDALAAA